MTFSLTDDEGEPVGRRVEIVEVGPRDGLQNEQTALDTATKLEYIRRLVGAGVRRLEAVSFVRPDRVPQMAGAEEVMTALGEVPGVVVSALVLNWRGFERALAAGVREVNAVVVATNTFGLHNQGQTTEESIAFVESLIAAAGGAGVRATASISVAFGCPYEGEVPPGHVAAIAGRLAAAGVPELVIADTIGAAVPTQIEVVVRKVREAAPEVPLRLHLHNTRNTGYANAVAGLRSGVSSFDASTGGIGGCPFAPGATGNVATEDLTYLLERMGYESGLDLPALATAGSWIGEQLGTKAPALLGRAGPFPPR